MVEPIQIFGPSESSLTTARGPGYTVNPAANPYRGRIWIALAAAGLLLVIAGIGAMSLALREIKAARETTLAGQHLARALEGNEVFFYQYVDIQVRGLT